MLKPIIAFEWRYHRRQPSFLAAAALFFVLGFALTASGFGAQNVAITSPFIVTETLGLLSLFSLFAVAVFVANAVLRDTEHRMEEIVFTTPIGRFNYVFGRFAGAFAAAATVTLLAPAGMMLATLMPFVDRARVGSLNPAPYLSAFAVMVLPSIFFATALLFAIATITRSSLATYTASVVIYFLYLAASVVSGSPLMAASAPGGGGGTATALLDPFGLASFFAVTRYWSIAAKNGRSVAFEPALLLNRAIWSAAAIAICAVAYRVFKFRVLNAKGGRVAAIRPARRTRASASPFVAALRFDVMALFRSKPFLLLMLLWFGLALVELRSDLFDGEYGSANYPTTGLIIAALQQPLSIVGLILVLYYGTEIFWREQRFRMASIIDATPVRAATMVLAKWSATVAAIALTIVLGIAAGIVLQLTHGYTSFEPLLYLSLFYLAGLPLALIAAAAVAIHALSPGKYAGLVFVLIFVIATRSAGTIGLDHPLWRYAHGPEVAYSAMSGFSGSMQLFSLLMLHWSVIGAAFLAVAALVWRRLREPVSMRFRTVLRHRAMLAAFAGVAIVTGGCVFYDTNIRRTRETAAEQLDWKAAYEKRYRPMAAMPQPRITDITTRIDLSRHDHQASIVGEYVLLNATKAPMRAFLVSMRRDVRVTRLVATGARTENDTPFRMTRFDFARPLPPGGSTVLHFELTVDDAGENGTLIHSTFTYPLLGYRATYEISDPRERAKRGLGPSSTPEADDPDLVTPDDSGRVNFSASVTTPSDQIGIVPGTLVREVRDGARRTFYYKSDAPIVNRFAIVAARYAVATRKAGGVDVSVYYHPPHRANVQVMLDTAVATIEYCTGAFGPYPHRQLKLAEVAAAYGFGGYAVPDTILFSENRSFLIDARDPNRPDLVRRRVAHEVAHQWFGYQLVAANRGGASMLTESLAKYTELLVLERMRGRGQVRQILEYDLDRYLRGRAGEQLREQPLANAGEQPYLYYGKGAVVFHAIRDLIGEPALNLALRRLIAMPSPTTNDLLGQLRAVSNPGQFALIDSWLRQIVLYDFAVDSATRNGESVTVRVSAKKVVADANGSEHEVPLDEAIDVAVGDAIHRVHMHSGTNDFTFTAKDAPRMVEVDPDVLRIDRNRRNNAKAIATPPRG